MNFPFPAGSYFYYQHDSLYYVFQLLEQTEHHVLVQAFWSTTLKPDIEHLHQLDVKSACTEFSETSFDDFTVIGQQAITSSQHAEIAQYLKIKTSKRAREEGFMVLKVEALNAYEKGAFEEAIRLFSLAAPYNKYDIELYEKRGICYMKLHLWSDALADFDYYLIHNPSNKEIQQFHAELSTKKKAASKNY